MDVELKWIEIGICYSSMSIEIENSQHESCVKRRDEAPGQKKLQPWQNPSNIATNMNSKFNIYG